MIKYYEITVYKKNTTKSIKIPIGYGKEARAKAYEIALKLFDFRFYDLIEIDCLIDNKYASDECISISKSIPF